MIVSPVVSSHPSRARLHVSARTQPMRRDVRQARSVMSVRDEPVGRSDARGEVIPQRRHTARKRKRKRKRYSQKRDSDRAGRDHVIMRGGLCERVASRNTDPM